MAAIPGLHANPFRVTQAPQNNLQGTSEGETLILRKISTEIRFDEKRTNKASEGFLLTTKLYKSKNYIVSLVPKKWKPEGKASIHAEGTSAKK